MKVKGEIGGGALSLAFYPYLHSTSTSAHLCVSIFYTLIRIYGLSLFLDDDPLAYAEGPVATNVRPFRISGIDPVMSYS